MTTDDIKAGRFLVKIIAILAMVGLVAMLGYWVFK